MSVLTSHEIYKHYGQDDEGDYLRIVWRCITINHEINQ